MQLLGDGQNLGRRDDNQAGVANKIRFVERQDFADAVYIHGSGKPGVVILFPGGSIQTDKPLLFREDRRFFREDVKELHQARNFGISLRLPQTHSVDVGRACSDGAKLNQILRDNAGAFFPPLQGVYGIPGLLIHWVGRVGAPQAKCYYWRESHS